MSDDNPFSNVQLKTLKDDPGFHGRFQDVTAAIAFCRGYRSHGTTGERRHGSDRHAHPGRRASQSNARACWCIAGGPFKPPGPGEPLVPAIIFSMIE